MPVELYAHPCSELGNLIHCSSAAQWLQSNCSKQLQRHKQVRKECCTFLPHPILSTKKSWCCCEINWLYNRSENTAVNSTLLNLLSVAHLCFWVACRKQRGYRLKLYLAFQCQIGSAFSFSTYVAFCNKIFPLCYTENTTFSVSSIVSIPYLYLILVHWVLTSASILDRKRNTVLASRCPALLAMHFKAFGMPSVWWSL